MIMQAPTFRRPSILQIGLKLGRWPANHAHVLGIVAGVGAHNSNCVGDLFQLIIRNDRHSFM